MGWLETSIRAYAKYVDVLARSLKDEVDEAANVRRERMRLDEIERCWTRCDRTMQQRQVTQADAATGKRTGPCRVPTTHDVDKSFQENRP